MNIKRIVAHHKQWCYYCKLEGVKTQGTHRMTLSDLTACKEHMDNLNKDLEERKRLDTRDYSEADYQTWLRL